MNQGLARCWQQAGSYAASKTSRSDISPWGRIENSKNKRNTRMPFIIHPSNITTPAPQPGYLDTYQFITNDTAVYAAASFIVMSMSELPPAPLLSLCQSQHHP